LAYWLPLWSFVFYYALRCFLSRLFVISDLFSVFLINPKSFVMTNEFLLGSDFFFCDLLSDVNLWLCVSEWYSIVEVLFVQPVFGMSCCKFLFGYCEEPGFGRALLSSLQAMDFFFIAYVAFYVLLCLACHYSVPGFPIFSISAGAPVDLSGF